MGNFIGHAGGFLILAAVVVLVGVFGLEAGIVKDKDKLISNGKAALVTAVMGLIYYFVIAYLKNIETGQTNIFEFNSIFSFCGIDKLLNLCENPGSGETAGGMFIPVFPFIVNKLGLIIFEQYGGVAVWLNFLAVCIGVCCLYRMVCDLNKKTVSIQWVFGLLILPYVFLLFTPGYFGITFGLVTASAYAFYKRKFILFAVLGAAAVCMSKFGLFFAAVPILSIADIPKLVEKLRDSKLLNNTYIKYGILYVLFIIDAVILFITVWG